MSRTFVLWLPPLAALDGPGEGTVAWLRIDDGLIVDSGQDDGWVDAWGGADDAVERDDLLFALAPAADVPLRWHHFPDAAPSPSSAAARIAAARYCSLLNSLHLFSSRIPSSSFYFIFFLFFFFSFFSFFFFFFF